MDLVDLLAMHYSGGVLDTRQETTAKRISHTHRCHGVHHCCLLVRYAAGAGTAIHPNVPGPLPSPIISDRLKAAKTNPGKGREGSPTGQGQRRKSMPEKNLAVALSHGLAVFATVIWPMQQAQPCTTLRLSDVCRWSTVASWPAVVYTEVMTTAMRCHRQRR